MPTITRTLPPNWPAKKLGKLPRRLGQFVLGTGLLLLAACTSSSSSEEKSVVTPAAAVAPTAIAGPARLGYFYQGTLAGRLAVHFYLLPAGAPQVYGQYRYAGRAGAVSLVGRRQAHGQLVLREHTNADNPQRPTAEFRLALLADGSLTGTWQTLPPARARLPGPVITGLNSDLPIITVADTAVTQQVRRQMRQMLTDDTGDAGTQSWQMDYADNCLLSLNVTSEMQGASVTQGNQSYVPDLRTGLPLTVETQVVPARQAALQVVANQRLRRAIDGYIRSELANGDTIDADDVAGLRQQTLHFKAINPTAYLADDSVYFPIQVEYETLSSFTAKMYHDMFAATFSFQEIQPYLMPSSPLRRLVAQPPARPAR